MSAQSKGNTVEIQSLTVSVQADLELTDAQKQELDRRLVAFEIDQDEGASWSSVKARILSRK
ncbi:MAG: addiction module protein [Alcanivorax sp.]|nr:addiction module protein [Alcanivorax sp.]MBI52780.1 addiction module protein [Alcanivorax sp.]